MCHSIPLFIHSPWTLASPTSSMIRISCNNKGWENVLASAWLPVTTLPTPCSCQRLINAPRNLSTGRLPQPVSFGGNLKVCIQKSLFQGFSGSDPILYINIPSGFHAFSGECRNHMLEQVPTMWVLKGRWELPSQYTYVSRYRWSSSSDCLFSKLWST